MSASAEVFDQSLIDSQRRVLWMVLILNAVMFPVELIAGLWSQSTALLADSADMLGDAIVYGTSLYVLTRGECNKAYNALLKGGVMLLFGCFIFIQAINKIIDPVIPSAETMGVVGMLALLVNISCFVLLMRHRSQDINMRSVWLCSRNDVVANMAVIIAGLLVYLLSSHWPDVIVGMALAGLFLMTALQIFRQAFEIIRAKKLQRV